MPNYFLWQPLVGIIWGGDLPGVRARCCPLLVYLGLSVLYNGPCTSVSDWCVFFGYFSISWIGLVDPTVERLTVGNLGATSHATLWSSLWGCRNGRAFLVAARSVPRSGCDLSSSVSRFVFVVVRVRECMLRACSGRRCPILWLRPGLYFLWHVQL